MVNKEEIMWLLEEYFTTTGTITIDDRGLASCTGNVTLKKEKKWTRLPVAFDRVDDTFFCYGNTLMTLEGAPKSVGGHFFCYGNKLMTLEGAPKSVVGSFFCSSNQLTSLEHAPQSVGGGFLCSANQLTSLEHAPQSVGGGFVCSANQLTSLEHAPQSVGGDFWCSGNKLSSLAGLPVVPGSLRLSYSPTLPLLRCLLAQQVEFEPSLPDKTVENILNKYAGQGRAGAIDCKRELVSAGFEENARW